MTTTTTTVKKGAGRPAAAAKRTRAAQRTPLPPKGEDAPKPSPAKATEIPADFPGADKAQRLLDAAKEKGWAASVALEGKTTVVVVVERGEESITVTHTDGKLDTPGRKPAYARPGHKTIKLNNVSAALKVMAERTPAPETKLTTPETKPATPARRARRTPANKAA